MRKNILVYAGLLALIASSLVVAGPSRTLNGTYSVGAGDDVTFDLSVGSVVIEATSSDQVQVQVDAECKRVRRCDSLLQSIEIISSERSGRLRLKVERPDTEDGEDLDLNVLVQVPRGVPFELDLGVGQAEIFDLDHDVKVDVGVGNVEVELSEHQVSDVKLDVGVGSAHLRGGNAGQLEKKKGFVGSTVRWRKGPGHAAVDVHVGVGEISMRLT